MIAILDDDAKLTAAPKKVASLKILSHFIRSVRQRFRAEISMAKPREIHCSNREWNRNSAFIMAQYELAHSHYDAGEMND